MKAGAAALIAGMILVTATGCSVDVSEHTVTIGDNPSVKAYKCISQQEAKNIMDSGEDIIILDVRRQDEYDAGHIAGAVLVPNENIHKEPPAELPDFNQKILVYCRSGNRSKQAAQKLANMGYTNVLEFGGINTWEYGLVKDTADEPAATEPSPTALLTSPEDIGLHDAEGTDWHYRFTYDGTEFDAYYTPDNWCIMDSYKIRNKTDIEIICQALAGVHPIHSADMTDWRTPEDMAYEWSQHNIAYSILPDDSQWKDSAKDVDIDPPDQGKSVYQIFKDRLGSDGQ